jgi:ankyrin repeat protein
VDQESKKFKRAADLAKDNGPEEIVKCLTEHVQSCSPCEEKETQEVDAEPTPVHDVNNMETLLIKAARAGQLEEVQNLLKKGANINALDKGCDTALIWACYMGHYDIAVELLKHHETVDVNHQNAHGSTALLWAVDRNHEDIVELLSRDTSKLDVNLKNEDGDTARSLASIAGRKDIVDKLLKHVKTNVDQESKKFKRAADLAKDNGPEEIVNCLTEHVQSCSNCAEQETQ